MIAPRHHTPRHPDSPRTDALRDTIQQLNDAGVRRTAFFPLVTKSLRETRDEPTPIRRAKAFAHLLDNVDQAVLPHELVCGSLVGVWPLAEGLPSFEERRKQAIAAVEAFLEQKRRTGRSIGHCGQMMWRDHYDANILYPELRAIQNEMAEHYADCPELDEREIGIVLTQHFQFDYGEETRRLLRDVDWVAANHLDLNYGKVLQRGLGDILREVRERLSIHSKGSTESMESSESNQSNPSNPSTEFYRSCQIALEAAIRFIHRYAETAVRVAEESPPGRAGELQEIARILHRVAEKPPESFQEAIQLVWIIHTIGNIGGGAALSFARFDQYLRPFYGKDIAAGTLSDDEARELIACLMLKVNEPHSRTVQSLCLAGVTPEGASGASHLTRVCLEACRLIKQPYPNVAVRVGSTTPDWLWKEITETIKIGSGHPMLLNDDIWVPNRERVGYALRDARDYYNMGCVEIMTQACMAEWISQGAVILPDELEATFRDPAAAEVQTFEAFFELFQRHVEARVEHLYEGHARPRNRNQRCDPFGSCLIEGCLESGVDMYQGGSRLPALHVIPGRGFGTAVDALLGVKRLVFEWRRITLPELQEILQKNWEGHEPLRQEVCRENIGYGNDDPAADQLAEHVFATYANPVHALNERPGSPGYFSTTMFSYTQHIDMGAMIPASPDGRRAGDRISNGIDPNNGADRKGPTALIKSVTAVNHHHITAACAFNMTISAGGLTGETEANALESLLRTYIQRGGCQIQVSFVDHATLLDAMEHPEQHRGLIVRVAGFSEYFSNLDRRLQEEVAARTAY